MGIPRWLTFAMVAGFLPATALSQVRVGPTFRVNSYTTDQQGQPDVAVQPNGEFVVTWVSPDGSFGGVFARRHDAGGTPLGTEEFRINAATSSFQFVPKAAALPGGAFLVVWSSEHDGTLGAFGRRFDAAGTPGPEFAVTTYFTGTQYLTQVASNATGHSVVVWVSQPTPDGALAGVMGQRYDGAGSPLGAEFRVSENTTTLKRDPAVAMTDDGDFVVAWTEGPSLFGHDIHARRYDSTGSPIGGVIPVTTAPDSHGATSVAMGPDGHFVVAWGGVPNFSDVGINARLFDATGGPLTGAFTVNVTTSGAQESPDVAMDARGNFVVVWHSAGSYRALFGRRFDAAGNPDGPEFPLDAGTLVGGRASVSMDDAGDFVTVWASEDGDVRAQRFRPDVIFKDGFDRAGLAAWSAAATDGGDLSVSSLGAMKGTTAGLRGVVDDTAGIYVQDDSPNGERTYIARFYLDPNGFDPGEAQQRFRTRVFLAFSEAPNRRVAAIVLRRLSGAYSIRARARLDDNSQQDTPFIPIDDGPHAIELLLRASSGPDTNGGRLLLFIDGQLVTGHIDLDNSLAEVDFVRMGALSVKPGANGTLHWDEFESRRQSAIGP